MGQVSEQSDAAARFRQHAEVLRAIAEEDADHNTRMALIRIAEDYEQMARALDALDPANPADSETPG